MLHKFLFVTYVAHYKQCALFIYGNHYALNEKLEDQIHFSPENRL